MTNLNEKRSEETKRAILDAAENLFAERGFDSVTMRQIAKLARCSHTTIYIYFKDKEALLHALSMPPLRALKQQMESTLLLEDKSDIDKLKGLSLDFIRFCLSHRTMYSIFFVTQASRVDEDEPALEINKLRIALFELMKRALHHCLPIQGDDDHLLSFSRIYFYTLHGIVGTYTLSEESPEALFGRLQSTFDSAIDILLLGMEEKIRREAEGDEGETGF